jgi:hypothetical protein
MSSIVTGFAGLRMMPLSEVTERVAGTTSYQPLSSFRTNSMRSPAVSQRTSWPIFLTLWQADWGQPIPYWSEFDSTGG